MLCSTRYVSANNLFCVYISPPSRSGMQRGGNSTIRMVAFVSLGALALMTFLYLMKRVEFNKTTRELELSKVE